MRLAFINLAREQSVAARAFHAQVLSTEMHGLGMYLGLVHHGERRSWNAALRY